MTVNAYLNRFRSVKVSPWPFSQCCEYSDENNIASVVENTSWKPLKMPFLRLKRLKMSLDASALKNLCLWCKFQSHLLFIISLLLENVLTALSTCLLDSACAKPNDSCKCWNILSRANWPIVGYTRSWYTGMRYWKRYLQAPLFHLSPIHKRFSCNFSQYR